MTKDPFVFLKKLHSDTIEIFCKGLHMDYDKTLSGNHKIKFFLLLTKMLLAVSNGMPKLKGLDKDLTSLA